MGGTLITLEQDENYPQFNLTVSTMFIQTLFRAIFLLKKMFAPAVPGAAGREKSESIQQQEQQMEEEEKQDSNLIDEVFAQVSPYVVRNLTGHPIQIEVIQQQSLNKGQVMQQEQALPIVTLASNSEQNMRVSNDEDQSIFELVQRRVRVTINMKKAIKIDNLDMDRIKSKLHTINDMQVYTSLRLDAVTNSKVLTIASPIIFTNNTDQVIILQISDKSNST